MDNVDLDVGPAFVTDGSLILGSELPDEAEDDTFGVPFHLDTLTSVRTDMNVTTRAFRPFSYHSLAPVGGSLRATSSRIAPSI